MKKRLSSEQWTLSLALIATMGLLFIMNTSMRAVSLSHTFGLVRGKIPIVTANLNDQSRTHYKPSTAQKISKDTTAIILTKNQDFYFADMNAFTQEFFSVRNKFLVKNREGRAQVGELLETIQRWHIDRKQEKRIENDKIAVLVPSSFTPMNVVIQVMAEIRQSAHFENIVLSTGLH